MCADSNRLTNVFGTLVCFSNRREANTLELQKLEATVKDATENLGQTEQLDALKAKVRAIRRVCTGCLACVFCVHLGAGGRRYTFAQLMK